MLVPSSTLLCIANIIAGLFYLNTQSIIVPETDSHWQLPHEALRLDQVHFIGAHNALISRQPNTQWGTFLYAQQTWNIKEQLDHGVRVFELDLTCYRSQLVLCHLRSTGLYAFQKLGAYETFNEIMHYFAEWLTQHPEEIVIFLIDSRRDPTLHLHMIDNELAQLPKVTKHILTNTMWNPDTHNGFWPTLKWMRTYNKRLVIFNDRIDDSYKYTFHQWSHVLCTPPHTIDPIQSTTLRTESCQHHKPHTQLYQLNHFTGIADKRIECILAISSLLFSANTNFSFLRPAPNNVDTIISIVEYGKQKSLAHGKNPNFIMLDNVDRFIANNGMMLINQWNQEELSVHA